MFIYSMLKALFQISTLLLVGLKVWWPEICMYVLPLHRFYIYDHARSVISTDVPTSIVKILKKVVWPFQYYFEDRFDLVKFAKIVRDAGLYMILRIGPFVAAEWNYGWALNNTFLCTLYFPSVISFGYLNNFYWMQRSAGLATLCARYYIPN